MNCEQLRAAMDKATQYDKVVQLKIKLIAESATYRYYVTIRRAYEALLNSPDLAIVGGDLREIIAAKQRETLAALEEELKKDRLYNEMIAAWEIFNVQNAVIYNLGGSE